MRPAFWIVGYLFIGLLSTVAIDAAFGTIRTPFDAIFVTMFWLPIVLITATQWLPLPYLDLIHWLSSFLKG